MESQRKHSFRDRFIGIQLTIQGTIGDLLAHNLSQLGEEAEDKENQQAAMIQISHLLVGDTSASTAIGIAPILLMLLHKMARRPRQGKHHLRTLLQPSRVTPGSPGTCTISSDLKN